MFFQGSRHCFDQNTYSILPDDAEMRQFAIISSFQRFFKFQLNIENVQQQFIIN